LPWLSSPSSAFLPLASVCFVPGVISRVSPLFGAGFVL
jgi:hypothetical protein